MKRVGSTLTVYKIQYNIMYNYFSDVYTIRKGFNFEIIKGTSNRRRR